MWAPTTFGHLSRREDPAVKVKLWESLLLEGKICDSPDRLAVLDPEVGSTLQGMGLTCVDRRQNERKKTGQVGARKKIRWVKR